MNTEKFKKDMAVFSFGKHQDVLTYLAHLETKGWTIEDAREWVQSEQERVAEQSKLSKSQMEKAIASLPKCPKCQGPLQTRPVNTGPGDQTGDDSKSMTLCMNRECMRTEYSTKTFQEQTEELAKK